MVVGGCTFPSDDIVIKSPTDRRLYRYVQLRNGLCALLVHDPEICEHSSTGNTEDVDEEEEDDDEEEGEDSEEFVDDEEFEGEGDEKNEKGERGAQQTKKVSVCLLCDVKNNNTIFD